MDITLKEFNDARRRISDLAHNTLLDKSDTFSRMSQADFYLKHENFQKTGSFKIRGATNKLLKMIENNDRSNVIASSAGNHAQGVACAAKFLGLNATVVMPQNAAVTKVLSTKTYGAEVVLSGEDYDECYEKAVEIAKEKNLKFVHPYNDLDVIAGQGTIGLEILEQLPDVDIVFVPTGGGGLLAGISTAIKKVNPNVKVYGVQADKANAIVQSFEIKKKVTTIGERTIADGIEVNNPGDISLDLIFQNVDGMISVDDDSIAEAVLALIERSKEVVEPAGAVSVAAALSGKIDIKGKKIVCVLSGGNIDVTLIDRIVKRCLINRRRFIELYLITERSMKSLVRLVDIISSTGANIIDIYSEELSSLYYINQRGICVICEIGDLQGREKLYRVLHQEGYVFSSNEENDYLYGNFLFNVPFEDRLKLFLKKEEDSE